MTQINIFEAKTNLSKYIKALLTEEESYIVIANHGKPVAKLVPYEEPKPTRKIGAARGKLPLLPDLDIFNSDNEEIAAAMMGERL